MGTAAVGDRHSTSEDSAVIAKLGPHTCGVGRVRKEMQQRLESLIEGCGMKWEGMVASFARLP